MGRTVVKRQRFAGDTSAKSVGATHYYVSMHAKVASADGLCSSFSFFVFRCYLFCEQIELRLAARPGALTEQQ